MNVPTDPLKTLPLSDEDFQAWQKRLTASRELRKHRITIVKECVQRHLGKSIIDTPDHDVVPVNKEFPFVEMKKSQLMFQVPELQLEPQMPGLEQATLLFQAAVNHELGPDRANLKATTEEAITEVLLAGLSATKITYLPFMGEREVQVPDVDPMTMMPRMDPMTGGPATLTRKEPYLIKEQFCWDRVPFQDFLLPVEFEGSDYDKAPWLAWEFEKDLDSGKKQYRLPRDFDGTKVSALDDDSLSDEKQGLKESTGARKMRGTEIWYYASQFDAKEDHPDQMRVLTLIHGWEKPVRHTNSPFQRYNGEGKLMGMKGNPLHPLTLRFVPDRVYPPSDVEMSLHISDELSKGRTQMVQQRESSIPMRTVDRNRLEPVTLQKVLAGTWQGVIPVDGNGQEILHEVARAQFPRENFTFQDIAEREYEEMWALGRNQRGLTDKEQKTATEVQTAQSAADVRLDAERARVLTWFTTGARKFGALLQLFKDDESYVEVLGSAAFPQPPPQMPGQPPQPQQPQGLMAWDRTKIQGEFLFKAKPDSALRIDAAARRKELLNLYQLTANDPNVARIELLKPLFRSFNLDPTRIVVDKLPEKGPEAPKVGISFKGEDLLLTPVLQFLEAQGVKIPPEMLAMAQAAGFVRQTVQEGAGQEQGQAPHGGAVAPVPPLSKHALRGDPNTPSGLTQRPPGVQ